MPSTAPIRPVEFRDGQREQWNQAAPGWRKWHELLDDATAGISERLVELAGVEPGSRVLDVAAGYGEPALTAARRAGPDGWVVATDIAPDMLAYGRERAEAAGLDNVEFIEAGAASLRFPALSFDAAVSRWGIIFEPQAEIAAARVRRFLMPGTRMAISSWGPPELVPVLGLPMGIAARRLNVPPPPPGTPGPFARPTPSALAGLLEGGGFGAVEVEEAHIELTLGDAEEFTTFVREITPPLRALVAPFPPEEQQATWEAIADGVRERAGEDGEIHLDSLALIAVGTA